MQSQSVEQIGGNHYKAEYQHWDFVDENNIQYLEGCATKYIVRWRKKNGIQDLHKALSYVAKRLASEAAQPTEENGKRPERIRLPFISIVDLERFYKASYVAGVDREICTLLFCWETRDHLVRAYTLIAGLISDVEHLSC